MKNKLSAFSIALLLVFSSCDNHLSDVELNTNPYDQDYMGPKAVKIDHARTITQIVSGATVYRNEIYVSPATQIYHTVNLYRNGVLIKTIVRTSYMSENLHEMIRDETPVNGVSYSYEVSLTSESSSTAKSEVLNYKTAL